MKYPSRCIMQLFDFINNIKIGKTHDGVLYNAYSRLNFHSILSRLACQEKDVYLSTGDGNYVPPFVCKFRKDKNRDLLAVANEDGFVMLIDTDSSKSLIKSFIAHHNAIFDICWLPDKNHLITASGDHRACLWDMNTCQIISSFKKHVESIKSVDVCHNDNALFATGSRDGTICFWDTRSGSAPDKTIKNAHKRKISSTLKNKKCIAFNQSMSSVSAVAFQDNFNLASSGVADGVVKIWDLRKTYISTNPSYVHSPRYEMKYLEQSNSGRGCTSLIFDSTYKKLYGCTTASKIFMFDCHTYNDDMLAYEGFKCDTYFVKLDLSADDQYLVCGSSDHKAYVWKTSKVGYPLFEFHGHNSEVTAVAWGSHDVTKLVTCGDDSRILIWKTINDQNREQSSNIIAEVLPYQGCEKAVKIDSASSSTGHLTPILKTPVMKSIASFFLPQVTPPSNSDIILSPSKTANQINNKSLNSAVLYFPGKENHSTRSSEQRKRKSFPRGGSAKKERLRFESGKKRTSLEGNITSYFSSSVSNPYNK